MVLLARFVWDLDQIPLPITFSPRLKVRRFLAAFLLKAAKRRLTLIFGGNVIGAREFG
jgi:hypothetical protein